MRAGASGSSYGKIMAALGKCDIGSELALAGSGHRRKRRGAH